MSTTTTAPPSGLTEEEKAIVSIVCSIAGLAIIALALRFLIPICQNKRYKKEPDDRSLFQSTQSLANTEHKFYYSGPVIPPREAKSDSGGPEELLPDPHVTATKHSYVNTVSEDFHGNSAWVSGFDLSEDSTRVNESVEKDNSPEVAPSSDEEDVVRKMTGEYSRQDYSVLHRYPRQDNHVASRLTRYETRQESPRVRRTERNGPVRGNQTVYSISEESEQINNLYDSPSRIPREVEPDRSKLKMRKPAMRSPAQSNRPMGYIRSMNSESGNNPRAPEMAGEPSWVGHALMMESNPKLLSAANMLRSRQYIDGAPFKAPDSEYLEWKEMKKYGHFVERGGPGTRTIYSLGKDAVRTPAMQEYVRSGNMRHDTAMQAGYGHVPMVPPGGYGGDNSSYYGNRNGMPGQSGGFVPIDSNAIPTYLPSENERQRREAYETSNSLNRELSSYLSGGSLKPLDMSSQYRENWDNQFDPYGTQERSLNHHTHPSENRLLPEEEIPSWYTARQIHQHEEMLRLQQQQQHLNQNLLKPVKGGKGKKGKGKK